ncbi:phospholipase/carboxylesterase [Microcella putealis]|uniref:Phospholipase/carboxylesterase n=1 Tax=Microcella putealis TaxID=337005 RepID=A0A4Q7LM18_9MICO|nr:alpha/beta hydrolase [Microcella putealis]RZS55173.1 phospholipase/carboxylesterase [Microcella putealis]TQM23565.1 phospholipase/carboxylesterase [Microcella putealis]
MTVQLSDWPHLVREPQNGASHYLLTLHGTGGNETEVATLGQHLDPNAGVLSPRGRVSEHGMTRWFARVTEGVFDVDDVIARSAELAAFIRTAREHYGIQDAPITAVGFSNGANIGTATALLHPETLTRVVAFSGMYPFGDRDPIGDASGVDLLLLNGAADAMAPTASVEHLVLRAEAHGAQVERHIRAGGHGIDMSDVAAAREWLAAR